MLPSGAPTRTSRPPSVGMATSLLADATWIEIAREPPHSEPEVCRSPHARRHAYDRRGDTAAITDEPDPTDREPATRRASRSPRSYGDGSRPKLPDDRAFAWIGTAVVVAIAGVLRLVGLRATRPGKIFDEIYYATEGNDLFTHGVEWNAHAQHRRLRGAPAARQVDDRRGEWSLRVNNS